MNFVCCSPPGEGLIGSPWASIVKEISAVPMSECQNRCHIPLVNVYRKLWNMAIEIVSFPIKNGDVPILCMCIYPLVT